MAKTLIALSLLVGAGACSSAPTATRTTTPPITDSPPVADPPTTTTEPTLVPTTTIADAPETPVVAPTSPPTTRARSAPTTVAAPSSEGVASPSLATRGLGEPPEYIKACESGGDYRAVNPRSGAGGAWQFLPSTWRSVGGTGLPQDASPAEQDYRAAILWANGAGASQWSCA